MKIAGWVLFVIGHMWVGIMLDFNLWAVIPLALTFTGGAIVGYEDAKKEIRDKLYAILQVEVDKRDR
jgi:hypothetical protein